MRTHASLGNKQMTNVKGKIFIYLLSYCNTLFFLAVLVESILRKLQIASVFLLLFQLVLAVD